MMSAYDRYDLHKAAASGDEEGVASILASGRSPDELNAARATPLLFAAMRGNLDCLKLLLKAGADPNAQNGYGKETPLMKTVEPRYVDCMRALIEAGADIHRRDARGWTALTHAAFHGAAEETALLLSEGADPNGRDDEGATPLMRSAEFDYPEVAEILLKHGADASLRDDNGSTADMIVEDRYESHEDMENYDFWMDVRRRREVMEEAQKLAAEAGTAPPRGKRTI